LITVLSEIRVAIFIREHFLRPRMIGMDLKKFTSEFRNLLVTSSHTCRKFTDVSTTTLQLDTHRTIFVFSLIGDEKEGTDPKIVPATR